MRVGGKAAVVAARSAGVAAASRARTLREAYETLGVDRKASDTELDLLFTGLLEKQSPESNPPEMAGYYEKKTMELRAAYACVMSSRGGSAPGL